MIFMREKLYPKFKDKDIVIILFAKLSVCKKDFKIKIFRNSNKNTMRKNDRIILELYYRD